jgi:hypothetical protein
LISTFHHLTFKVVQSIIFSFFDLVMVKCLHVNKLFHTKVVLIVIDAQVELTTFVRQPCLLEAHLISSAELLLHEL